MYTDGIPAIDLDDHRHRLSAGHPPGPPHVYQGVGGLTCDLCCRALIIHDLTASPERHKHLLISNHPDPRGSTMLDDMISPFCHGSVTSPHLVLGLGGPGLPIPMPLAAYRRSFTRQSTPDHCTCHPMTVKAGCHLDLFISGRRTVHFRYWHSVSLSSSVQCVSHNSRQGGQEGIGMMVEKMMVFNRTSLNVCYNNASNEMSCY
jgi:hypothetical protein